MRFVDIHTHILHNIDDGSQSLEMSCALLRRAYDSGTRAVFFTPHCDGESFDYAKANAAILELKPYIKAKCKDLLVFCGCEMMVNSRTEQGLLDRKIPTLAGSRYVLIEFDMRAYEETVFAAVRTLTNNGFSPIIAHAERYRSITLENARRLVDTGAYLQLNCSSVCGKKGVVPKTICASLLKEELVHFIASDCHNPQSRPSDLSESAQFIRSRYGKEYARQLFYKNALKIVDNEII